MTASSSVDRLLTESERLRKEMLKMAERLGKFSDDLLVEVRTLRAESGQSIERGGVSDDDRDGPGGPGESGPGPS